MQQVAFSNPCACRNPLEQHVRRAGGVTDFERNVDVLGQAVYFSMATRVATARRQLYAGETSTQIGKARIIL